MLKGIDVSNHQGGIDWLAVKNDGIDFAIIRSSYGWFTEDSMFRHNVNGCEAVGLPYGLYHYSYARNLEEAKIEVEGLIRLANSCNPSYPIIIDMEDADNWKKNNGNPNNDMLVQILEYQCKKIEEAGYYAMIYANLDWFTNRLNDSRLDRFDKWLAQWYVDSPAMNCGIWQYGANGVVAGINGNVDVNYSYNDYSSIIKGMNKKPVPEPQPTPNQPTYQSHIKVGDKVKVTNPVQYSGEPFAVYYDTYDVIEANGDRFVIGQGNVVTCAVHRNSIVSVNDINNNSKPQAVEINKGDKVRVVNAIQYNGEPFAVYFHTYDVIEVSGDRVVIGQGSNVTCAIHKNNIAKV